MARVTKKMMNQLDHADLRVLARLGMKAPIKLVYSTKDKNSLSGWILERTSDTDTDKEVAFVNVDLEALQTPNESGKVALTAEKIEYLKQLQGYAKGILDSAPSWPPEEVDEAEPPFDTDEQETASDDAPDEVVEEKPKKKFTLKKAAAKKKKSDEKVETAEPSEDASEVAPKKMKLVKRKTVAKKEEAPTGPTGTDDDTRQLILDLQSELQATRKELAELREVAEAARSMVDNQADDLSSVVQYCSSANSSRKAIENLLLLMHNQSCPEGQEISSMGDVPAPSDYLG